MATLYLICEQRRRYDLEGIPRRPQYINNRNIQYANQCAIEHILCTYYHHRETRGSRLVHNNQPAGVKAMRRLYTQRREFKVSGLGMCFNVCILYSLKW